jgi:hypothetical protein
MTYQGSTLIMEMKVNPTKRRKATKSGSLKSGRNLLREITVPTNLPVMTVILPESDP